MHYFSPPFFYTDYSQPSFFASFLTFFLFPLIAWHIIWKGLALWFSARNRQKGWFIALLIINTLGILEIIYLCCFRKPAPAKSRRQSK